MKKGFTMIELIFVIVILGILAAVAIPKLAATRDDARIASGASEIATAVADFGAAYTARGTWQTTLGDVTNVAFANVAPTANLTASTPAQLQYQDDQGNVCITMGVRNGLADGNLTVAAGGGAAASAVCRGLNAALVDILSATCQGVAGVQCFGGSSVVW